LNDAMSEHWYIIADDFTGSGDSAVQFRTADCPARLVISDSALAEAACCRSATVIDTDSRFLAPDQAYAKVLEVVRRLRAAGARLIFKKLDSTLRGQISDEIAAVMDGAGYECALVCPAAPRNARVVTAGFCFVDGEPIGSRDAMRDPFTPVIEPRIASHFQSRFQGKVEEIGLAVLRSGECALREAIAEGRRRGTRIFVADAESLDDLSRMAALKDEDGLLFAGSSGLAEALAGVRREGPRPLMERVRPGSALFMVGSVTPTADEQCARLASSGRATEIVVDGAAAAEDEGSELGRVRSLVAGAPRDKATLIRTSPVDGSLSAPEARERGAAISRFMGAVALAAARDRDIRFLFASGGDTAARIVLAFGADYIEYFDEPLPGLPFGSFRSAALGRSLGFASKSGGFGAPDALVDVLSIATRSERSERK